MLEAFDEAWNDVAPTGDPMTIEARQLKLAGCVAVVTAEDVTDTEQIRRMAIHMLWIIEQQP
jgi:hypothetical protein